MANERVRVKIVSDLPADGDTPGLAAGTELVVDSTTAAALVLSGAAIELPID
jgi:hypothetical protein